MNLAYRYPIIFWNCACLITDSGGNAKEEVEQEEYTESTNYYGDEDIFYSPNEEEEEENDNEEVAALPSHKAKARTVNYGKIATAIGKMREYGITVSCPNINKSSYTFSPDVEENVIRYGMSGISRIGEDLVNAIIDNRPYSSIVDFLEKVNPNKVQMVNLIKAGCFDEMYKNSRKEIMEAYIDSISDKKKKLTLQNMKMLVDKKLLPDELDFEKRLYHFNQYLKKSKVGEWLVLDDRAMEFYEKNYNVDLLQNKNGKVYLWNKDWEKMYKKGMEKVRIYLANHPEILERVNDSEVRENWEKYANGCISKWEMDALSCYNGEHELLNVNEAYELSDFRMLPDEPIPLSSFATKDGKQVSTYELTKIAGTVIDKDKSKNLVILLTVYGVVEVKLYKTQFVKYDKQISTKDKNGVKKVLEKSWFTRGNKLMIVGMRRGNNFIPKLYKNSPYANPIMLIDSIDENGFIKYRNARIEE